MGRATLLAAALATLTSVGAADDSRQLQATGGSCAWIDKGASSAWVDSEHQQKKFVFRVHVRHWEPFARISMTFPNEEIELENMYDARPADDAMNGDGTFVVELGPTPSERNTFLMMGSGTNNFHPQITCECESPVRSLE